jgi:3D (Asp-Asp-Asp) domain-containing protein
MNKKILISLILISTLIGLSSILIVKAQKEIPKEPDFLIWPELENRLITFQGNSLLAASEHFNPEPKVIKKMKVVVTGYSSTIWETDETPELTASGTQVREGVVASNGLPIGTKIKIPEIFGDKIFVIEDRMNPRVGPYHIDIWFPDYSQAKNFGTKRTYIEILEG